MKLAGDYTFAAPQPVAWSALLDPTVLASVLPGCERLELTGENEYEGQLQIKIGPVQGSFLGKVTLQNIQPPNGYDMLVDGRGAPGFVKATAHLALRGDGANTHLTYDADAQVGGKIASVGQRLVESSAKAIIKQSLEGLNAAMIARAAAAAPPAATAPSALGTAAAEAVRPPAPPPPPSGAAFAANVAKEVAKDLIPPAARWAIIVVVVVLLAVLLYRVVF